MDRDLDISGRRSNEMNALRSIQTARAVVSSERQKLLARTQNMSDRPLSDRFGIHKCIHDRIDAHARTNETISRRYSFFL